ncbi:unnamed protein product [Phyllotreta striolata]|uniref:Uncharacterized protein n=1 Tax=Phyllotreta striolata TaxID=444603 RepID=A0A9N9TVX9_PHYSR|nr:unnamed protein product [Phyllotreta striolata]
MTNKPKIANKKSSHKTRDPPNSTHQKDKTDIKLKTKDQDSLILRYLTKLKKLFHNKNQETQPVNAKGNELQEVMYNMVNEALDYGYRNRILEKRGTAANRATAENHFQINVKNALECI